MRRRGPGREGRGAALPEAGAGAGPCGEAAPPGGAGRGWARLRPARAAAAAGSGAEWGGMAGALTEVLGEVLVAGDGEEVAVSALAARGVSLVGLYFGCSLGGPCAQLGASLAAFYGRFRGEAAAAGGQRLEIVFVSAEQEQQQWQEAVRAMPWLALPFADKHRKVRPRAGGRPWPGGRWGGGGGFVWGRRGSAGPPHPDPRGRRGGSRVARSGRFPESSRGEPEGVVVCVCVCLGGGLGVVCRPAGRRRFAWFLRFPGPAGETPQAPSSTGGGGGGKGGGNPGLRVVVSGGGAVGRHPLAWRGPSEERGRQARRVREVAPLR